MKLLLFFFLAPFIPLDAQKEPAKFGEISVEDFRATQHDSLFSSVVLFNKGKYSFDGPHPIIENHIRIKINKNDAFKRWGIFRLGNDLKSVSKIKAATYYIDDGKIISQFVEKDDVFFDRKSGNQKTIILPNLREGCIVELSYTITYNDFLIPTWLIQDDVPILWCEYQMKLPANLSIVIQGKIKLFSFDPKYNRVYSRWIFKDVPAFKDEPLMPNPINYFARIEFWNASDSWSKVNENYLKRHAFEHERFRPNFLKRIVDELVGTVPDSLNKIKVLSQYMKENFKWNADFSCRASDFMNIYEKKEGDSGDLNIFFYAMLRFAGFKPNFVLVRTSGRGFTNKDLPSERQFNNILCYVVVDGKEYLLDVTNPLHPFDIIPSYCLNTDGFMISQHGFSWVRIHPGIKEKITVNAWLSIAEDELLKGRVIVAKQGYSAFEERKEYLKSGDVNFKKENSPDVSWMIDSARIVNINRKDLPVVATYYTSIPEHIVLLPSSISVNPYILIDTNKDVWKSDTRQYPIDLELPLEKTMIINISIPEGFEVEELPEDIILALPDNSISCSYKMSKSKGNITVVYNLSIKKTWFEKDEYKNLREFNRMMTAKENESIVLVKK